MAFKAQNLTLTSPINVSGPKYYLYLTATDTTATVGATTYFRPFAGSINQSLLPYPFSVGDVILCNCSDGLVTVTVSSINPITTAPETTDIAPGSIVNADINAAAAIAFSKLAALPSAQILVGSAGNVATAVAMSGDVAIANTGATTIQAGAIDLAMLSAGITPSHVIKAAGRPTTVGGAALETFAVAGSLTTDQVFTQIVDDGTAGVTILQAWISVNGTLSVTFSANPGNDTIFAYQVIRAAA